MGVTASKGLNILIIILAVIGAVALAMLLGMGGMMTMMGGCTG